jgi:acetoin utilization deacetylase AcuC-like enzyme
LTTYHFRRAIDFIINLAEGKEILLLGGGGYHPPSTAKHFALLTGLVLGQELSEEIPVEAEFWEELEKDGGIHVGRDSKLRKEGEEEEVERLCMALETKVNGK